MKSMSVPSVVLGTSLGTQYELKYTLSQPRKRTYSLIVANWKSAPRGPPPWRITTLDDQGKMKIIAPSKTDSLEKVYSDLKRLCRECSIDDALSILNFMGHRRPLPADIRIYVTLLKLCTAQRDIRATKQVHRHMKMTGANKVPRLALLLVKFYALCGKIDDAYSAFEASSSKTAVLWHAIIRGYLNSGSEEDKALRLYDKMIISGFRANAYTFSTVLKVCSNLLKLGKGKQVHGLVIKMGFEKNEVVASALINLYSKCLCVEDSCKVFEGFWNLQDADEAAAISSSKSCYVSKEHAISTDLEDELNTSESEEAHELVNECQSGTVVLWTAMIDGLVRNQRFNDALCSLREMGNKGYKANPVTLVAILPACEATGALQLGREVHAYAIRHGFDMLRNFQYLLMRMYSQFSCFDYAHTVFNSMVIKNTDSWEIIMMNYARNGQFQKAFDILRQWILYAAVLNVTSIINALELCGHAATLYQGKAIHAYAIKHGFAVEISVVSGLITMYSKCFCIDEAIKVLSRSLEVIKKNLQIQDLCMALEAFLEGCILTNSLEEAIGAFYQMRYHGWKPTSSSFLLILQVHYHMALPQESMKIHAYAIKTGFLSDLSVCSSLINIYGKCGYINSAFRVFDDVIEKDIECWNAIIRMCSQNRQNHEALNLFHQLQLLNVTPNHSTFSAVLPAYANADTATRECLKIMEEKYNLSPKPEQYANIIRLLGRAGMLQEARDLVKSCDLESSPEVWKALLGACRSHSNVETGKDSAECLIKLESHNAEAYIQLANIYAKSGLSHCVNHLIIKMRNMGLKGVPDQSWIVTENKIRKFNQTHWVCPDLKEIIMEIERIEEVTQEAGYKPTPSISFLLKGDDKEHIFCAHTEILAIVFSLMTSSYRGPIHVTKNSFMCEYCHRTAKSISTLVGRTIIVSDASGIHQFERGACKCQDYWW